jgi:hypothetical protein
MEMGISLAIDHRCWLIVFRFSQSSTTNEQRTTINEKLAQFFVLLK